jgi:pyruvate dehydrogenase E2 component (dihydrolipoamide acetyltransferase)
LSESETPSETDAEPKESEQQPKEPAQESAPEKEEKAPQRESKPEAQSRAVEVKLPELGENVESGTITQVLVSEGDTVEQEQEIVEVETDKAAVQVPSTVGGRVKEIRVKSGEDVNVGQTLLVIESTEAAQAPSDQAAPKPSEARTEEAASQKEAKTAEPEPAESSTPSQPSTEPARAAADKKTEPPKAAKRVPAAPSVRRFAREIGIDITDVPGSGPGNRISIDDVKRYSKMLNEQKAAGQTVFQGIEPESLPDFSKWGEVERVSMSKVRSTTAKHLGYAWATAPHVTQFDKADITHLESLRKQYGEQVKEAGGKLTVTAILLKVIEKALKRFPQMNASVDMEQQDIIYKKYYHIGVAVDTDRGLLVPVIRDVDRKNLTELSIELTEVAQKARDRKLSLEDMQGGNFSISNLGGIGGTGFSPVVNTPEVGILGVARAEMQPVYQDGNFEARLILPLSLSYDHRLIDGADGARFLRWVAEALERPFSLLFE